MKALVLLKAGDAYIDGSQSHLLRDNGHNLVSNVVRHKRNLIQVL